MKMNGVCFKIFSSFWFRRTLHCPAHVRMHETLAYKRTCTSIYPPTPNWIYKNRKHTFFIVLLQIGFSPVAGVCAADNVALAAMRFDILFLQDNR